VFQVFVGFSLYKNTQLSITEIFPSAIAKASEVYVSTTRIQVFQLSTLIQFWILRRPLN